MKTTIAKLLATLLIIAVANCIMWALALYVHTQGDWALPAAFFTWITVTLPGALAIVKIWGGFD